ncbi:hypothetical protein BJ138DRAFT_141831 [Hygrophoropsis aurantiaca]|uniref:Uncharacterized protein n=1 Tax=Hygrophoropsis aurantiaca TaxID=72124 RepID=A0ACB8ABQ0_9AGAM|nr:hypothetical protein BJ138DRAFT_141831 [Hygrophoropsis aurantiaca]
MPSHLFLSMLLSGLSCSISFRSICHFAVACDVVEYEFFCVFFYFNAGSIKCVVIKPPPPPPPPPQSTPRMNGDRFQGCPEGFGILTILYLL